MEPYIYVPRNNVFFCWMEMEPLKLALVLEKLSAQFDVCGLEPTSNLGF